MASKPLAARIIPLRCYYLDMVSSIRSPWRGKESHLSSFFSFHRMHSPRRFEQGFRIPMISAGYASLEELRIAMLEMLEARRTCYEVGRYVSH